MRPFDYVRPNTLDSVLMLLSARGSEARLLAGGTDLLVRLRLGHIQPSLVVDLKRVASLRADVEQVDSFLRIGARTVMTDLIRDERLRRHFPALVEAAAQVGSVQTRNRATLVGNICNASPAADTAPALLVHGAVANLIGLTGGRRVALTDFFLGPGRSALKPGELVQSVDLPLPSGASGAGFSRVTRRYGVDIATINVCCLVSASGETRFAYGAAGPRPFLVADDTGVLADERATPAAKTDQIRKLVAQAAPISDVRGSREYRLAMLEVMSRRTLRSAIERLRGTQGSNDSPSKTHRRRGEGEK